MIIDDLLKIARKAKEKGAKVFVEPDDLIETASVYLDKCCELGRLRSAIKYRDDQDAQRAEQVEAIAKELLRNINNLLWAQDEHEKYDAIEKLSKTFCNNEHKIEWRNIRE